MKKYFISALIALMSFSAFAQETKESLNQRFFDTKIKEFTYRLDLSDKQKALFIPVYQRYCDEMHAAMAPQKDKKHNQNAVEMREKPNWKPGEEPEKVRFGSNPGAMKPEFKHGDKPGKPEMSSEAAAIMVKGKIRHQMAAQEIRLKYVDEFAEILEPHQLVRLFDVESQIQKDLFMRKNGHKGPGRP